jgi:hypothetical protein
VMASSQLYGSVVSPKGKSLVSSIAPRVYHLNPSRISLGQRAGFSYPNFASSEVRFSSGESYLKQFFKTYYKIQCLQKISDLCTKFTNKGFRVLLFVTVCKIF